MGDMFGGKLTGGIFAVIGAIIGFIMVGILAGPFGSLVSYFSPAAEDPEGNRFNRVYTAVSGPTDPKTYEINIDTNRAGGSGMQLSGVAGTAPMFTNGTGAEIAAGGTVYSEQGEAYQIGSSACAADAACTVGTVGVLWKQPPRAFSQLNFLNRILATLLALVAAIGLIMKTKNAYDAFKGGGYGDLGSIVMREVTSLVLGVVGVYLAPTMLNILGDTAFIYTSGQYDFAFVALILKIVFAVVPTMVLIGIMGLISGLQVQRGAAGILGQTAGKVGGMRRRRRPSMLPGR